MYKIKSMTITYSPGSITWKGLRPFFTTSENLCPIIISIRTIRENNEPANKVDAISTFNHNTLSKVSIFIVPSNKSNILLDKLLSLGYHNQYWKNQFNSL
ncbi:MAG: hypothetical protein K0Q87_3049 [Neobacillus sp.]|nr:hypothetical protein [Neobacillus sp.]